MGIFPLSVHRVEIPNERFDIRTPSARTFSAFDHPGPPPLSGHSATLRRRSLTRTKIDAKDGSADFGGSRCFCSSFGVRRVKVADERLYIGSSTAPLVGACAVGGHLASLALQHRPKTSSPGLNRTSPPAGPDEGPTKVDSAETGQSPSRATLTTSDVSTQASTWWGAEGTNRKERWRHRALEDPRMRSEWARPEKHQ